jgi:hypothetical protein
MNKKHVLAAAGALLVLAIAVLVSGIFEQDKIVGEKEFTFEQSKAIAEGHVLGLYPYSLLNGGEISLVSSEEYECDSDSCYSFKYQFQVDSQVNPGQRELAQAEVFVESGLAVNTVFSEELIIKKEVEGQKYYCQPSDRNAEFCAMVYDPVCANNQETYGNICTACIDPEVEYYTFGECETIEDPIYFCNPEDREAQACVMIYDPVCADSGETYSNSCLACIDSGVQSYKLGECS